MAARSRPSIPSYRLHKSSGLAVVRLNGHDVYLGRHGTPESRRHYEAVIAEWLAGHRAVAPDRGSRPASDPSVNELILAYMEHATGYYMKHGRPTGEVENLRFAFRPLASMYGGTRARDFGPLALRAVRERMIASGLARGTINARVNRVRRLFKWSVEHQLVDSTVLSALQSVGPLRRGRSEARETEPVRPVSPEAVEAVLKFASPPVAAMIRLQLLTGMRPGEVTAMRLRDLDTTGEVWRYIPASHKTEHHGRMRVIYFGPKAQGVLRPFVSNDPDRYLFRPSDAMEWQHARRRGERKTPLTPSQRERGRKASPQRTAGERYTTHAYAHAIAYACDRAHPVPDGLDRAKERAWRRQHRWSPNQLRHSAATELRRRFGLDAARVVLGHSSPTVTEIYAEIDQSHAVEVMAAIG